MQSKEQQIYRRGDLSPARGARRVCPGDNGHAAFGNFNTKRYDIFMFLGGQCGRLACGSDGDERTGTARNLAFYQRGESVPVTGTISERSDESWD